MYLDIFIYLYNMYIVLGRSIQLSILFTWGNLKDDSGVSKFSEECPQ